MTLPDGLSNISSFLFKDCSKLTSVTLPSEISGIGESAFNDCSGLTAITIPDSVSVIGKSAFSGCSKITSIVIPDKVKDINANAFSNCTELTTVTIPNILNQEPNYNQKVGYSIGDSIFDGCAKLTSITYNGTKENWDTLKKHNLWSYNAGNFTLTCSDGTKLDKNGIVIN